MAKLSIGQDSSLSEQKAHVRLLLFLMFVTAGIWIAFAKLAAPPIIKSAYRGQSLSFLNSMIHTQVHSVDYYLQLWHDTATVTLVSLVGFWLIALVTSSPAFFKRFVGEATPASLGAIRMWTCAVLLLTTSLEHFSSIALLPVEMSRHGGAIGFLYSLPVGYAAFVRSELTLRVFQWIMELILFLGVIGWHTRVVIPLGALCHFLLLGTLVDYSFFWHQNLVLLYLMVVLSFTPCGDGCSIDRLLKVYRNGLSPDTEPASPIYGLSRYACWLVIALPYVQAGLSKLRDGGLLWWNAANIRANLYGDTLNPREFNWSFSLSLTTAPDILFAALGIFTIIAELSVGLMLFSRMARRICPILAMMMHLGILLLQRILFLDLILIQFVFFDFSRILKTIRQRLMRRRGPVQILYDGSCPLCQRTVRLLACLDLFQRLQFLDFRVLDLSDYNRTHALNLKPASLEKEMYVVSRGRAYAGFYGYRVIALAVPVFWLIAPWLFLPIISWLGASIYGFIARNRMNVFSCDSHCSVPLLEQTGVVAVRQRNSAFRQLRYSLMLSAIVLAAAVCWRYHVEFFPLTSWDVYSYSDVSGKVTYLKVFGRDDSGKIFRARLEDGIGALSYDGRYSRVLQKCYGPSGDVDVCKKFLAASASAYNKRALAGSNLTQYEIQKWTWDFRDHPTDPQYGSLTDRFVFPIDGRDRALKLTESH